MKRLLLPLIAVLALPTAVNAESVWLLIKSERHYMSTSAFGFSALEKIEMSDLSQCQNEGKRIAEQFRNTHWICVKGK